MSKVRYGGRFAAVELAVERHGGQWLLFFTFLDQPAPRRWPILDFLSVPRRSPYMVTLAERDEAGATALRNMRDFSLNDLADTLERSAMHVQGWCTRATQQRHRNV